MPVLKSKSLSGLLLLLGIALAGVGTILYQTRSGPGLTSDSVIYLQGAQNLQMGRGFSRMAGDGGAVPITDFPPVFSALLALASGGNTDLDHLLQVGRWLNAVLFGGNIFLASWLVHRRTKSWKVTILTGALLLTFYRLIRIHSWLMTEGVFIFFLLLAILFLDCFFVRRRFRDLLVAGLAIGLLILIRYAGLAFWLAATVSLWFFQGGDRKKRIVSTAFLGLESLILPGLWGVRNVHLAGKAVSGRQIGWYALRPEVVNTYLREGTAWVLPAGFDLPPWLRGITALIIIGLLLFPYLWRKRWILTAPLDAERRSEAALPGFLFLAIMVYLVLLVANSLMLDASTTVYAVPRYLLPGWVCFVILSVCAVYEILGEHRGFTLPKLLTVLYVLFFLSWNVVDSVAYFRHAGYGLMGIRNSWQQEQQRLEQLPVSSPLISTDPERLYVLIGRPSYRTPRPQSVYTRSENERYLEELNQMRAMLRDGAFLVIVAPETEDQAYLADLTQDLEAVIMETHIEVYRWNDQSGP